MYAEPVDPEEVVMEESLESSLTNLFSNWSFKLFYLIFFWDCILQLPDYHEMIEHPMDFSTVRKKLAHGSYSTLEELEVGDKFVSQVYMESFYMMN